MGASPSAELAAPARAAADRPAGAGALRAVARRRVTPWAATALALPLVLAITVRLTLQSDHLAEPGLVAAYRGWLIAAPALVGLLWWRRRPADPYGPLLAALGIAAATLAFGASDQPLVFTLGVLGEGAYFTLVLFLCVAFPSGRLRGAGVRALIGVWVLGTLIFTASQALLADRLTSGGAALVRCDPRCPHNPFVVADAAGLADASVRLALLLALVASAGLGTVLVRNLRFASRPQRRELALVSATTFPLFPVLALICLGRLLHASPATMDVFSWVFAVVGIAFPLGFLAALLEAELFAGRALRRLLSELAQRPAPARWRGAVAAALDDPSLALGFWDPARRVFRRPDGATLERPAPDDGRRFTLVEHDGRPVAAITTDAAMGDHPELLAAAAQATLIAVRTGHLEGELRDSRRRLLAAATDERRRIQRDLHDSAQQRLVALRVNLELAAEDFGGASGARAVLGGLGAEVDEALADVRRVAHGLYPPVLETYGVVAALRSACANTPLPVRFIDEGVGRYSPTVESTLYFCCLEALQNTSKHAGPSATATVRLGACDAGVWFSVADDGVGFALAATRGSGLANLNDRVAALGGTLDIETAPGRGTRITGRFAT